METIELTRLTGDRWRWSFSDGNGSRVYSNDVYGSAGEAEHAARRAYPDLEVIDSSEPRPREAEPQAGRRVRILLLALVAALVVALGWHLATRAEG